MTLLVKYLVLVPGPGANSSTNSKEEESPIITSRRGLLMAVADDVLSVQSSLDSNALGIVCRKHSQVKAFELHRQIEGTPICWQ